MHHRQALFWRETQSSGNQSPQLLNVSVGSGEGERGGGEKKNEVPFQPLRNYQEENMKY